MDELLILLAQLVAEFFLQFIGELLLDFLARAASDVFKSAEPPHPVATFFGWGFLGALAGAGSLVIFPHPVFRPSRMHGISLIVSPALTGLVMSAIGALLRKRGKRVVQIETFPYAFAFALGMAVVRLVWTS